MSDKISVLLKLNMIIKQRAEKDLADAMRHVNSLSSRISGIHQQIQNENKALYNTAQASHPQSDVKVFEQWKRAQLKHLSMLAEELKQAEAVKSNLALELKTQTVRQDMLKTQMRKIETRRAEERDELTDERNLEGWLNQNRFA